MTRISFPRGFTLIEVTVALLLTGIVLLLAHALLTQVVGGTEAIARQHEASRCAEDRLWFLDACRGIALGGPRDVGFVGTEREARFTTRLPDASGRYVERPAVMSIADGTVAVDAGPLHAVLADSLQGGRMEYLSTLEGSGGWVVGWDSPISAPVAIRVRWIRDGVEATFLCPVGVS